MSEVLVWWVVFSAGVLLALVGGRRPTLAERVRALRPEAAAEDPVPERVFSVGILEAARPGLEAVGGFVGSLGRQRRVLRLIGLDPEETARRLALAGRPEGISLYFGTKVFYFALGLATPVLLGRVGLPPLPAWMVLGLGVLGFFVPDLVVTEEGRRRRLRLEDGLVETSLAIASAVGAGSGVEEAFEEAGDGEGPFFEELERALAEARAAGEGPAEAVERVAARTGLEEARNLGSSLRAAAQGAPLTETLLAQAHSITERHRLDSLAAGQRAEIRMLLIQAAFILPGFFVLVLYPVGATLFRFAGGS